MGELSWSTSYSLLKFQVDRYNFVFKDNTHGHIWVTIIFESDLRKSINFNSIIILWYHFYVQCPSIDNSISTHSLMYSLWFISFCISCASTNNSFVLNTCYLLCIIVIVLMHINKNDCLIISNSTQRYQKNTLHFW